VITSDLIIEAKTMRFVLPVSHCFIRDSLPEQLVEDAADGLRLRRLRMRTRRKDAARKWHSTTYDGPALILHTLNHVSGHIH
jgi:hypothetical protein